MGLSFLKQVQRKRAVTVRFVVTAKYLDENGCVKVPLSDRRTFHSSVEAHSYALALVGTEERGCVCYAATVATEYANANRD